MLNINSEFPLRDKGVSNALEIDKLPRHRWYFVKEGFSPKLVEQALEIDGAKPGELLFDPFSGSGTVALSGAMAGLRTLAFEINPFLHFLSTAKLKKAKPPQIRTSASTVVEALGKPTRSPLEGFSTFTKGNRWNRWLFSSEVLRAFEAGKRAVAEITNANQRVLLKLALIGAAMDCCNATRDGKCLRFAKEWTEHEASAQDLSTRFKERVEVIAADLEKVTLTKYTGAVIKGDARKLTRAMNDKFRICVTSPPYLNSFDYSDIYRPELFLGGFVNSTKELRKIRLKTIRSHVQVRWAPPEKDDFGCLYLDCIKKLRQYESQLWDSRLTSMVQAYFEDMEIVLKAMRLRAAKNASLWLVVSTSAYGGVEVPVDLILAEIGQRAGWFLRDVGVLRYLRSSSQHFEHVQDDDRKAVPLRESVVIFDATTKRTHV